MSSLNASIAFLISQVCGINPRNALYCFGGEDGIVEFWDPRERKAIGFLNAGDQVQRSFPVRINICHLLMVGCG